MLSVWVLYSSSSRLHLLLAAVAVGRVGACTAWQPAYAPKLILFSEES